MATWTSLASRRVGVTATCAALLAAQLVLPPVAMAQPKSDKRLTTSARDCATSGDVLRYVVLFEKGTSGKRAERAIARACGKTTTYYRQIGVAVATSVAENFADLVGPARALSAQKMRRDARAMASMPSSIKHQRPPPRPTDPDDITLRDRTREQWDMRMINADLARQINSGSPDVVVGVLDSGVDAEHPELADAIDPDLSAGCLTGAPDESEQAWTPTNSGHGTHVAGTIAAADDGAGITGIAPDVRLASIRVIGEEGYVDPEAAVCGFMWAAEHEMQVTNSSYVVDPSSLSCGAQDDPGVAREAIARAAEHATSAGALHIAAATNDAVNLSPAPGSASTSSGDGCQALPASLRSVVAVSSVGPDQVKAGYSSYGLGVISLTAPGGVSQRCVLSTVPSGYDRVCGTSMAAPHVAGVAALVASANPGYDPQEVRDTLTSGARTMACPTDYDLTGNGKQDAYCSGYRDYNGFYGHGMVDALAAVDPDAPTAGSDPLTGSAQQQAADAPGRGPHADRGQGEQVPKVADHGRIEHAGRQSAHQVDTVIQR